MDLDFDLLDDVLDGLLGTYSSEYTVPVNQIRRETNRKLCIIINQIVLQRNWNLIDQGLATPLVCFRCFSQVCTHVAHNSSELLEVWNSTNLAKYGKQVELCNLDFGLLN